MGTKLSLCQAITTPDVYVKLETPQKELQKQEFLTGFPQIQKIFMAKLKDKAQKIVQKYVTRKFVQGIYVGPVNANVLPHSQVSGEEGIFMYKAGFLYVGGMKNGNRADEGMLINEDGEYYTGQWSDNNPNGSGEYVSTQSSRSYKGQWKQGLQHGQGAQQYDDLSIYTGQFSSGLKHGPGRLTYPDGTYYQGQFSNNTITGTGICRGKFHKYQGQWLNGKMHGNGISQWNDENGEVIGSYLGQYRQGLKHGYGEYRWGGKKVYKGRWEDGDMCNEGVVLNYEA